jgi:hypothetical protein
MSDAPTHSRPSLLSPAREPNLPAAAFVGYRLRHHRPGDRTRDAVQAFIESVYRQHYGARITAWAPMLVSLESDAGIAAAAGYRLAESPLYLEHYLHRPVEEVLAAALGHAVRRTEIVEIGHLAARRAGSSAELMLQLGLRLHALGLRWVASTVTQELRRMLGHMRLYPLVLGPADPCALGSAAAQWGSYYEHAPRVVAGEIAAGLARLRGMRQP